MWCDLFEVQLGKKREENAWNVPNECSLVFLGLTCVSPGVCQKDEVRLELSAAQCRELAPESTVHTICRDLIMINLLFQKSYALLPSEAASESKKLFVTSSKATFTCKFETIQPISWDAFSRWLVRVHNSAVYKNSASLFFPVDLK